MKDTCIIYDDATEKLANALDIAHKVSFNNANDDEGLHNFVINTIGHYNFKYTKLIIPCNIGNQSSVFDFMGISLGIHIRLTKELEDKRLISLIFIDNKSVEEILRNQVEKTGYLLTTKGCQLVKPNGSLIKNAIANAQSLHSSELKTSISQFVLTPPEDSTLSRHSIANQWGAMKLNEVAEVNALGEDSDVLKKKKLLYYKWLLTRNEEIELEEKTVTTTRRVPVLRGLRIVQAVSKTIESIGRKILLIDDESDKGWNEVLTKIFTNETFFSVPPNTNQGLFLAEARKMIASKDWDLILLDLRLTAEDHDRDKLVDDFQGTKLLKEIKDNNNGTQVIIFTASNKAWNMQKLLFKYDADGYYIKEAPDFDLGKKYTEENYKNFKEQVKIAFERDYLRWFWKKHQELDLVINNLKSTSNWRDKKLYDRILKNLEQTYTALKVNKNNESRFLEYAYLNYYQLLENIAKLHLLYNRDNKENYINTTDKVKKVIYNRGEKRYSAIRLKLDTNDKVETAIEEEVNENTLKNTGTLYKICVLLLLKYNANNTEVRNFIQLNELRNEVVAHAKKDNRTVSVNHLKKMYKLIYWLLTSTKHT